MSLYVPACMTGPVRFGSHLSIQRNIDIESISERILKQTPQAISFILIFHGLEQHEATSVQTPKLLRWKAKGLLLETSDLSGREVHVHSKVANVFEMQVSVQSLKNSHSKFETGQTNQLTGCIPISVQYSNALLPSAAKRRSSSSCAISGDTVGASEPVRDGLFLELSSRRSTWIHGRSAGKLNMTNQGVPNPCREKPGTQWDNTVTTCLRASASVTGCVREAISSKQQSGPVWPRCWAQHEPYRLDTASIWEAFQRKS